ncbi:hypothetical protein HN587_05845 [Candidatus Woesearchaeota archaeon]|jgi:hypothetical protein|nr:hypothetical protein [Candidatus Woesearchaeota archaeon]
MALESIVQVLLIEDDPQMRANAEQTLSLQGINPVMVDPAQIMKYEQPGNKGRLVVNQEYLAGFEEQANLNGNDGKIVMFVDLKYDCLKTADGSPIPYSGIDFVRELAELKAQTGDKYDWIDRAIVLTSLSGQVKDPTDFMMMNEALPISVVHKDVENKTYSEMVSDVYHALQSEKTAPKVANDPTNW